MLGLLKQDLPSSFTVHPQSQTEISGLTCFKGFFGSSPQLSGARAETSSFEVRIGAAAAAAVGMSPDQNKRLPLFRSHNDLRTPPVALLPFTFWCPLVITCTTWTHQAALLASNPQENSASCHTPPGNDPDPRRLLPPSCVV